ncbi:hypothetical protein Pen02_75980 [Plantactinospora endophytica]|uniref:Uncharacterized protein n=1 Tax=Plantactinospora endophytica TaxID=673535 RepID=A0ABQ4ED79_9ACTN|nr:hypothetical protein Pen02_75980 [Plantactinospora endophytica]
MYRPEKIMDIFAVDAKTADNQRKPSVGRRVARWSSGTGQPPEADDAESGPGSNAKICPGSDKSQATCRADAQCSVAPPGTPTHGPLCTAWIRYPLVGVLTGSGRNSSARPVAPKPSCATPPSPGMLHDEATRAVDHGQPGQREVDAVC